MRVLLAPRPNTTRITFRDIIRAMLAKCPPAPITYNSFFKSCSYNNQLETYRE